MNYKMVGRFLAQILTVEGLFMIPAVIIGYVCGIMSKLTAGNINYVLALYLLNLLMVSVDLTLYFRNRRLDMELARI